MKRRQFLAGVSAGIAAGSAGCLSSALSGGGDPPGTPEPLGREVVDETWKAGMSEPNCETAGEKHYSIQNRKSRVVGEVPESADIDTIEAFVQEHSEFPGEVTILEEKPARLAWRERSYDISERHGTDLYYVGYVGPQRGPHSVLVLLYPGRTDIIHFLNKTDCPGVD